LEIASACRLNEEAPRDDSASDLEEAYVFSNSRSLLAATQKIELRIPMKIWRMEESDVAH